MSLPLRLHVLMYPDWYALMEDMSLTLCVRRWSGQ